jgi:hypothetical protein
VVTICGKSGDLGLIQGAGEACWVELSALTAAPDEPEHAKGDINGDGVTDLYDLSLLNEFLKLRESLPAGVSIFRGCEAAAADINSDGIVDTADAVGLLLAICE